MTITNRLECFNQNSNLTNNPNQTLIQNKIFNSIDHYIVKVENTLCSLDCPCNISSNNPKANSLLNNSIRFQDCPKKIKNEVYNSSKSLDEYLPSDEYISNLMNSLEEKFSCTGFCSSTYLNETSHKKSFSKFLFTNINKIPESKVPCVESAYNWFLYMCKIIAGYGILMALMHLHLLSFVNILFKVLKDKETKRRQINILNMPEIQIRQRRIIIEVNSQSLNSTKVSNNEV